MLHVKLASAAPDGTARHVTCSTRVAQASLVNAMAIPTNRSLTRPAKDEWGVYDPQQAGLAALFARLDTKDAKPSSTLSAVRTTEMPEAAAARPSTLRTTK